jgi:hypothetical protein
MLRALCTAVGLSLLFAGCKDESRVPEPLEDYQYFPLQPGDWIAYDVDSVVHYPDDDSTPLPDTSIAGYHYQVKEIIDSAFVDGEGDIAYKIVRQVRATDTLPWSFESIWSCKRTFNSAQRVEDNIRYVKLAFPVTTQRTWNGNAYNELPGEDYFFEEIHQAQSVGSLFFDSTVTVNQYEFLSAINRIIKKEKYARGVGLVYRQRDSLNINGLGQVINGIEFTQTVTSYGR